MTESLREEIKPYLRSMITASHYNQLDDNEFNKRIAEVLSLIIEKLEEAIRGKYPQGNSYADQMKRVNAFIESLKPSKQ